MRERFVVHSSKGALSGRFAGTLEDPERLRVKYEQTMTPSGYLFV